MNFSFLLITAMLGILQFTYSSSLLETPYSQPKFADRGEPFEVDPGRPKEDPPVNPETIPKPVAQPDLSTLEGPTDQAWAEDVAGQVKAFRQLNWADFVKEMLSRSSAFHDAVDGANTLYFTAEGSDVESEQDRLLKKGFRDSAMALPDFNPVATHKVDLVVNTRLPPGGPRSVDIVLRPVDVPWPENRPKEKVFIGKRLAAMLRISGFRGASKSKSALTVLPEADTNSAERLIQIAEAGQALKQLIESTTEQDAQALLEDARDDAYKTLGVDADLNFNQKYFISALMSRVWSEIQAANKGPSVPSRQRRALRSRRDTVLTTVETQDTHTNSSTYSDDQIEDWLQALKIIQAHVRQQLFPVLNELITASNYSVIHSIAWSIWSDVTLSTLRIDGPFMYGLSAVTSLLTQHFDSSTNVTAIDANSVVAIPTNDTISLAMVAISSAVEQLYFLYWEKAINATNATGQLSDMSNLAFQIMVQNSSTAQARLDQFAMNQFANLGVYGSMYPPLAPWGANGTSNNTRV